MASVGLGTSCALCLYLKRNFYQGLWLSVSLVLDTSPFLFVNFSFKCVQSTRVPFDIL